MDEIIFGHHIQKLPIKLFNRYNTVMQTDESDNGRIISKSVVKISSLIGVLR